MKLRGLTLDRDVVYFDIKDVPVAINDSLVVLTKRNNSPIIVSQSIARGTDDNELFETDFVLSSGHHGVVGFVVYKDGFYIWSSQTGSLIPLRSTEGLVFVANTQMHRIREMEQFRSKIRFGSGGRRFGLDKLIYYNGDEVFITLKPSGPPVMASSIKYGTGVNVEKRELLYGQATESGIVVMHDYHPMLRLPGGSLRELEVSDYG